MRPKNPAGETFLVGQLRRTREGGQAVRETHFLHEFPGPAFATLVETLINRGHTWSRQLKRTVLVLFSMLWLASATFLQDRPRYTVYRAGTPVVIDGRLDEPCWFAAPDVGPFVFPWWKEGKQEQTVAKMLWEDDHLYVAFLCEDGDIWAEHTQRDSPVWKDDAVELFTAPDPDRPRTYFNIEMNVLGIFLDRHRPRWPEDPVHWDATGVRIATSIHGTLNDDTDRDAYWILEAAIPFHNFAEVARRIPPREGDLWRLNLNRLGGKTNLQYSQWSASRTPEPQFHAPDDFGEVIFSETRVPFLRE